MPALIVLLSALACTVGPQGVVDNQATIDAAVALTVGASAGDAAVSPTTTSAPPTAQSSTTSASTTAPTSAPPTITNTSAPTNTPPPTAVPRTLFTPQNALKLQPIMLSGLSANVQGMGWSPDSRLLAVGVQSGIEVINPVTNARPYNLIATGPSYAVRFSPDGAVLGIELPGSSVRLWDLTRNIALSTWDERFSSAAEIAFSPDKLIVAVSDEAGMVDLWNSNTAEIIRSIDVTDSFTDFTTVNGLEFSPDGSRFVVFGQSEGIPHVYIFDTATGDAIDDYNPQGLLAGPVAYPVLPPNWRYIAWVSRGTVLLIDPTTHNEVARFNHEDFVTGVSFTPNADLMVTSSLKTLNNIPSNVVSFWNTQTGALIGDQPGFTSPPVLAFSPDGTLLATGSENYVETWIIGQ